MLESAQGAPQAAFTVPPSGERHLPRPAPTQSTVMRAPRRQESKKPEESAAHWSGSASSHLPAGARQEAATFQGRVPPSGAMQSRSSAAQSIEAVVSPTHAVARFPLQVAPSTRHVAPVPWVGAHPGPVVVSTQEPAPTVAQSIPVSFAPVVSGEHSIATVPTHFRGPALPQLDEAPPEHVPSPLTGAAAHVRPVRRQGSTDTGTVAPAEQPTTVVALRVVVPQR